MFHNYHIFIDIHIMNMYDSYILFKQNLKTETNINYWKWFRADIINLTFAGQLINRFCKLSKAIDITDRVPILPATEPFTSAPLWILINQPTVYSVHSQGVNIDFLFQGQLYLLDSGKALKKSRNSIAKRIFNTISN